MSSQLRRQTILVTGGTGLLGSHIIARLLADGHNVLALARGRGELSAAQRMVRRLDWFGLPHDQRDRLEVLEGRLERPGLGLDARSAQYVRSEVDETIHCASDTSFSADKREQVVRANVQGLEHLLDLLQGSRCRTVQLISTAYVAGKRTGSCPEAFGPVESFHNVYEETKYRAERTAAKRCARNGIVLTVHRPSIVYGDAVTGRTFLFNALYYPVRTLHFFQKVYAKDILSADGAKARAMGVCLEKSGELRLPLRIAGSDERGVNLIPVDHFVRAFMAIRAAARQEGGVFHIVNPRTTTMAELVDFSRRFFGLTGIEVACPDDFDTRPRNGLELLFENHIHAYGSYMHDARIFEHSRAAAILTRHDISCPEFTSDIFATCMRYALEVDWGRNPDPVSRGSDVGSSAG
ncbi:SDR family oxidoreductase [Desulfonatronum lacustre]|uniref:SDR family oxidoreductase n=1 Tax=Desulfonatronum lacustre TaxID=66849 RepID=UPI0004910B74|nr:SDR family oxidoreductase [Desulfonatronum lacustre]SMP73614.1 Male sterility protein [Desulfonatronum zhilinae]